MPKERKVDISIFIRNGRQYWISSKKYEGILRKYAGCKDGENIPGEVFRQIAVKEYELGIKKKEEDFTDFDKEQLKNRKANIENKTSGQNQFVGEYVDNHFIEATIQLTGIKFSDLCTPFYTLDQIDDFVNKYPVENGVDKNDYGNLISFINMDDRKKLRDEIRTKMKED